MHLQHDHDGDLGQQAAGLFAGERDPWANAANLAALLFESLPDLNWAGFYFLRGGGLVVGPFQGRIAWSVSRSARESAARPRLNAGRSSSPTSMRFPGTLPATPRRTRKSSCP